MITNITTNNINSIPKNNLRKNPYLNQVSPSSAKSDGFEISAAAQEFSAVLDAIKSTPDIREERVSAIQAQMNTGNYNISSEAIASKMLAHF